MFNTVILYAGLGSLVLIEQFYPELFTLTGARQRPANFFEKLCARNIWKVVYYPWFLSKSKAKLVILDGHRSR